MQEQMQSTDKKRRLTSHSSEAEEIGFYSPKERSEEQTKKQIAYRRELAKQVTE